MSLTRVLVAFPQGAFLRDYEKAYVSIVSDEIRQNGSQLGFVVEAEPSRADLIVLLPSAQYKTIDYIRVLENDPLVRNHAERVYVIDYDDHPEGMLAGLYTSIEHPFFDPQVHRSWPILFMNNPLVYNLSDDEVFSRHQPRLFSFVGAASHKVRNKLFTIFSKPSPDYHVEEIKKWYNHNDDDRTRFVQVATNSVFCLCPRGYASYTNRIPEVMALARVPVMIADDWIPFAFGEGTPYYIRVKESDVERLPEILSARRNDAQELGRNARELWKKHCSATRRVVAALQSITKLAESGVRRSFADYRDLWHSRAFLQRCGWTLRQRVSLRLRQHLNRWLVRHRGAQCSW